MLQEQITQLKLTKPQLRIALISDFFYPNLGGVEMHIYHLAYCLIERGHHVIVLTHRFDNRSVTIIIIIIVIIIVIVIDIIMIINLTQQACVRYMSNGIKVYYFPFQHLSNGTKVNYPCVGSGVRLPLFRDIMLREQIDLIHGHQCSSPLQIDSILLSGLLNIRTVFTDHSMWELNTMLVNANQVYKAWGPLIDHAIGVSHAVRENYIIKSNQRPQDTSTIPNAIDAQKFKPDPTKRFPVGTVNIVIMSRLDFKKGTDLLVEIIPKICRKYPNAYFIIGGDGPKMPILRFMVQKCGLEQRVELLGRVPHEQVNSVLNRGHIFINTSISEAFCIAVLEAVACGLKVVTTDVGGIPEILPADMVVLAKPNAEDLNAKLEQAIANYNDFSPSEFNERVNRFYTWRNVSERTETVYYKVMLKGARSSLDLPRVFYENQNYFLMGLLFYAVMYLIKLFLDVFRPASSIEKAREFPHKRYWENPESFGSHQFDVFKEISK